MLQREMQPKGNKHIVAMIVKEAHEAGFMSALKFCAQKQCKKKTSCYKEHVSFDHNDFIRARSIRKG